MASKTLAAVDDQVLATQSVSAAPDWHQAHSEQLDAFCDVDALLQGALAIVSMENEWGSEYRLINQAIEKLDVIREAIDRLGFLARQAGAFDSTLPAPVGASRAN